MCLYSIMVESRYRIRGIFIHCFKFNYSNHIQQFKILEHLFFISPFNLHFARSYFEKLGESLFFCQRKIMTMMLTYKINTGNTAYGFSLLTSRLL